MLDPLHAVHEACPYQSAPSGPVRHLTDMVELVIELTVTPPRHDGGMSNVSVIAAVEALDRADLACADTAACVALLRDVRRTRGWLDAVEARISSRMRDLSTIAPDTSSGPAAIAVSDLHSAVGGVSAAEGRRRERRSKTLDEAASFADALEQGRIGAEHVDALANATAGLDASVKTELLADHASLLAAATSKTPGGVPPHLPGADPPVGA